MFSLTLVALVADYRHRNWSEENRGSVNIAAVLGDCEVRRSGFLSDTVSAPSFRPTCKRIARSVNRCDGAGRKEIPAPYPVLTPFRLNPRVRARWPSGANGNWPRLKLKQVSRFCTTVLLEVSQHGYISGRVELEKQNCR